METTSRKSIIISAIVLILVIGALGFQYFLNSNDSTSSKTPPKITINYPKYKGSISGDVVCQIPGTYAFNDNAPAIDKTGAVATLQTGIHIYHSDSDITVQKIIDKIDSVKGNKILIAYYPSSNNDSKKFSVYKSLAGQNDLALSTKIPANEGFTIFSCKETKIYGIKTETEFGSALPAVLATKQDNGWVLMAAPQQELKDKMKDAKSKNQKVKSTWAQQGVDFNFGTAEEAPEASTLKGSYKMVWVEFAAITGAQQKATCEASPACAGKVCTPYYLGGYSCSVQPAGSGASGVDICNTTGGTFNSSGCSAKSGVPYPPVSGVVSGKVDYCNTTGGSYNFSGCISQKTVSGSGVASGVDVCNTTGGSFNSTGCFVSGGTPYPSQSVTVPSGLVFNKSTSTLSWNAVTGATGYLVYHSIDGVAQSTFNTSNTSWQVSTYDPAKTYIFKVLTVGQKGTTSSYSTPTTVTATAPVVSPVVKITGSKVGNYFSFGNPPYTEVGFDFSITETLDVDDKVIFDFGDGSTSTVKGKDWFWGNEVSDKNTSSHNYSKSGQFTVKVKIVSNSGNGTVRTSDSYVFNFSPVKITSCTYGNQEGSGTVVWVNQSNNTGYSYKLNFVANSKEETIDVYSTTATPEDNGQPLAKMYSLTKATIYNLSPSAFPESVSLTPVDSNGVSQQKSDPCTFK